MFQNAADARGAVFSDDRLYRYRLWRTIDAANPKRIAWLMLNPSTADTVNNDPTIRRCIYYSTKWGFGRLDILNIFAFRSPDPKDLDDAMDPVGPDNNMHIMDVGDSVDRIMAAWGVHGVKYERAEKVSKILRDWGLSNKVMCLGKTKAGHPRHPLYVRSDAEPVEYYETGE